MKGERTRWAMVVSSQHHFLCPKNLPPVKAEERLRVLRIRLRLGLSAVESELLPDEQNMPKQVYRVSAQPITNDNASIDGGTRHERGAMRILHGLSLARRF